MGEVEKAKYRKIVELGRGGMGEVYLAVACGPAGFERLIVLKELRQNLAENAEFLAMFSDEARLCARLRHPGIVQTNEVGQMDGRHFIAMEYLEGQSLHRIAERVPASDFPLAFHLCILVEALSALDYAHHLKDIDGSPLQVVHRDISPQNVLVTYDGHVKIVDFGIAKARDSSHETATGTLKGKVAYMSPEQVDNTYDLRADIFAVGVMLWEAIARRRMWHGKTQLGILKELGAGRIPSLLEAKPDAPEELARICSHAIAFEPADRYSTAAEMAADLESYLAKTGTTTSSRAIGAVLSAVFAAEREKIRGIVEAQLRELRASTGVSAIPPRMRPREDSQNLDTVPGGSPEDFLPRGETGTTSTVSASVTRTLKDNPSLEGDAPSKSWFLAIASVLVVTLLMGVAAAVWHARVRESAAGVLHPATSAN